MTVRARGTMCLDGDFSRQYPQPEVFATKSGDLWTVVKRGPRYVNSYEVTEYDEAGLAWLEAHRHADAADPTTGSAR